MSQSRSNGIVHSVLVTGAGGFLGARMTAALAAAGFRVIASGRTAPPVTSGSVQAVAWDGRLPPPPDLAADAVVDCAAAIPARIGNPELLLATNAALVRGAAEVAARGRGTLLYMSSQSAIGRPPAPWITDATPPQPDTPYGQSKLAAERLLADAAAAGRIAGAVAFRLPAVIGPGCHDNFPAAAAARLLAGQAVTLFNPDGPYNAVVHADTAAAFARHLLLSPPSGFRAVSLASRPPLAIRSAVEAIARGAGVECRLDVRPAPHASPLIDPAGAEALGFVPDDTGAVLERFGREAALRIATPAPPR